MLKKRFYIALSFVVCCLKATDTNAQVTVNVPAANIIAQTNYAYVVNGVSSLSLSIGAKVLFRANTGTFAATTAGSTASLPLNLAFLKLDFNSLLGVSQGTEMAFCTVDAQVYSALVALNGSAIYNYRIATASNHCWQAATEQL